MRIRKIGLGFAIIFSAFGFAILQMDLKSASRNPASFTDSRSNHKFDLKLIERIVQPDRSTGDTLLQDAVVPRKAIENIYRNLDQSKSLAWQMEMLYGLNEITTSYYPEVPDTYVKFQSSKSGQTEMMGVAPNCFVCHSSRIEEEMIVGLGNTRVDLRTFFSDLVPKTTLQALKELPQLVKNLAPVYKKIDSVPLRLKSGVVLAPNVATVANRTRMLLSMYNFVLNPEAQSISAGHSNPWGFAVQLFKWRDNNLDYLDDSSKGRGFEIQSVVLDPMPWWNLKYKNYINWDSIIKKSHRSVVQAVLAPGNSGEEVRNSESLYKEIYDEIHRLDPPIYPFLSKLDEAKVAKGEKIFNNSCSKCHGLYSDRGTYYREPEEFRKTFPEVIIPGYEIGTDGRRLVTINLQYLRQLEESWVGFYKDPQYKFRIQNEGYVAPPLWGVWASAPYFHNGSVPTLYSVLFPETRPTRWKMIDVQTRIVPYDYERLGLKVIENPPANLDDPKTFDTTLGDGRSKSGHENIFQKLDREQKLAILEYLKTL